MVLRAELFGAQFKSGHDLLGQNPGVAEAEGEERDLGDQRVVGHHHSDWTEQSLKIWK